MTDTPKDREEDLEKLKEVPMARRRVLMVNPSEFAGLFTKGLVFAKRTRLVEGLPDDALLLGTAYDIRLDAILMVVESEEFDEVPMTELPPRVMVSIETGISKAIAKKKSYRKK